MILTRYVTSYQTKAEKNEAQGVWENVDENRSKYGRYKSAGLQLIGKRDLGAYECADKLLGHHLFGSSDQVVWVGADIPSKRGHRLKSKQDLEKLPESSTNIFHENMVENYYPNRPIFLENISLYEVASKYEKVSTKPSKEGANIMKMTNNKGYFKKVKEKVVKSPYVPLNKEHKERYFHNLLMLFKPWRNEENDLLNGFNTYEEAFKNCASE